ncbi:hypothetical protein [Pseudonocardia xishanensis]|uniref:Uncharacterized protein n=1 Tax=Pseudonocardia xishanensis TaxID=630995 RepID=A0ABP8RCY1_9PSEU
MNQAVEQLERIVSMAQETVKGATDGFTIPYSMFDMLETGAGFGLSRGYGLSLVYGDVTDAAPGSWSLQIASALAVDVPHRPEIGMWVNEMNSQAVLGKYYYRVTQDGTMSAAIWEMFAWSRLFEDLRGAAGQAVLQWLIEHLREALNASSEVAAGFIARFGGRQLMPNEDDMTTLLVISSG